MSSAPGFGKARFLADTSRKAVEQSLPPFPFTKNPGQVHYGWSVKRDPSGDWSIEHNV